jgi:hypothetical protein
MLLLFFLVYKDGFCQISDKSYSGTRVVTAVPFISVTPDARAGGIGETGVATAPDEFSLFWNTSKLAFYDREALSLSYNPWLKSLLPSAALTYASYVRPLSSRNAIGASLRYFNVGQSLLYDQNETMTGIYRPVEFAFDLGVARTFGRNFSLGLTGHYIYSKLTIASGQDGLASSGGSSAAVDISMFYRSSNDLATDPDRWSFGVNVSNIGTKMGYSFNQKYFLPANLTLGGTYGWPLGELSRMTFGVELSKRLVSNTFFNEDLQNSNSIYKNDRSVVSSIFGSFSNTRAGFSGQVRQISLFSGVEYEYNNLLFLRAGYCYEPETIGNRRYPTLGAGLSYKLLKYNFSYVVASQQQSPIANALRFSVTLDLNRLSNQRER